MPARPRRWGEVTMLKTQQVADILGVTDDKVYAFVNAGRELPTGEVVKLAAHNIGTLKRATWRFDPCDVQEFLKATRTQPTASRPRPDPVRGVRRWMRREPLTVSGHAR
jgi:hypothetical protein